MLTGTAVTTAPLVVLYLLPCGQRRLVCAIVLRCHICGGAHTHRLTQAETGRVTRRCPNTKARYTLPAVNRAK